MVFHVNCTTFASKMANDYFQFRQFIIRQNRCAMKVGTDGTLLGAWADCPATSGPSRILDIGTGTGLIALMMAQRFPCAQVTAIDIDPQSVAQARENVAASPFSERIIVHEKDLLNFSDIEGYDAVVCNPPYFVDSLTCPDDHRTTARHTVSLTYEGLMRSAFKLLKPDGLFSLVIPSDSRLSIESEAHLAGFFLSRVCLIRTTPKKAPKRQLIEFCKHSVNKMDISDGSIEISPNVRSPWYQQLTQAFYIK